MCFALVQEKAADGGSDSANVRDYHHQDHQQDQNNRQAALSYNTQHSFNGNVRATDPWLMGSCIRAF